jgi:hypothetical protein
VKMSTQRDNQGLFVGINVSGGIAYLGVANAGGEVALDDPAPRIGPNAQLDVARRLEDFRSRIAQELRRIRPQAVGVARTRRYQRWGYQEAFDRFTLEAAVMLAAVQEGFPCRQVKQEDAARATKVPVTKIAEALPERLGIEPTPYWRDRSVAFATALTLAEAGDL